MPIPDDIAAANKQHWQRMVEEGCGFTRPWLDLDRALVRQYARGLLDCAAAGLPDPVCPTSLLADAEGKDVLCLASGGGQQSAVFGLLGAHVTVVDLVEGQLQGDRAAAAHYGYAVTTACADMRDLSPLPNAAFDLVYQPASMSFVPNVRPVYAEVARVLRPGGLYWVCFTDPGSEFVDHHSWDGTGYRIAVPYAETQAKWDGSLQFRHLMADIFNGLIEAGMPIELVEDDPACLAPADPDAQPGTWTHAQRYLGAFAVLARRA